MKEAAESEWEETQQTEGPGRRLKAMREVQELGLPRVASLLHLDQSKLEALEKDEYEKLPGSVFVRGYLKNYARLLNVPADQILGHYDRTRPVEERRSRLQISGLKQEVGSGYLSFRPMIWGIIIGLIVLVALWWKGQFQWPLLGEKTGNQGDIMREVEVSERSGMASLPGISNNQTIEEGGESKLMLPPIDDTPDLTQQEGVANPPDAEVGNRLNLPPSSNLSNNGSSAESALASTPIREAQPSVSEAPADNIVIELIADSWVHIKDAGGSFKIQDVLKQGTQRVLQGRPPYQIVLGKASAVRLKVKGKVFDLAPYTLGDVARLSLNPD